MTEAEYIRKLKSKDEKIYKHFVETYQEQIIRVCYSFVHNIDDANDIAQEVFINVFNSISKFKGNSALTTWLYRMAVNKSLNFIRDNKKRKFHFNFESIFKNGKSNLKDISDDSLISYMEKDETEYKKRLIFNAIDNLPENQRTAFLLNKYEEKSYKEITEIMKISHSAVESLIFRAKNNLKEELFFLNKKNIYRKKTKNIVSKN